MEDMLISRKQLSIINLIGIEHGRCGSQIFKWQYKDTAACKCGEGEQTIKHIIKLWPKTI